MGFTSSFFSIAGQKERLTNVKNTLQLAASKITVGVIPAPKNTDLNYKSSTTIGKIADAVLNNPKTAALAVTGATYAVKAAAPTVKSQVAKAVGVIKPKPVVSTTQPPGIIKPSNGGGLVPTSNAQSSAPGIITPSTPSVRSSSTPRRKRKTKKKASSRKGRKQKRNVKRYGTAKQYARPGGKKVYYAKNGTPYIIQANGKARFVKGKRK